MADPEWKTVRLRAAKHAVITKRAKADGISVAEWLDRTLAVALDQSPVHPGRTDAQDGTAAEHSQSMLSGPAPRRAPNAVVVFPASALVNESEAERGMRLRARAEAERAIVARQAKLNAAKAGQPKRKES